MIDFASERFYMLVFWFVALPIVLLFYFYQKKRQKRESKKTRKQTQRDRSLFSSVEAGPDQGRGRPLGYTGIIDPKGVTDEVIKDFIDNGAEGE